ncbi:MAG TPA: GNAT family N-acetyltransferase [Ktedonobacteraceae bacterium]|nr:GNAT family N-acetyltransferase [Ktedonobacteraceae bacterium]
MSSRLTSSPDFVIRSTETVDEIDTYFRLNAETFRPDEDPLVVAARRRRMVMRDPNFQQIQLRSAFYGNNYIGSCRIQERWLSLEASRLHVGCVGGVVTHPDYRHQGVATALMQDAFEVAKEKRYDLLLLHGIADYYKQHGYIDVFEDMPRHTIERALIPAQPVEDRIVRLAEAQDAPALLALYQEHYGNSMCTFAPTRTLERQVHYLENWFQENIPLLAVNTQGNAEGYLLLSRRRGQLYAYEAAANTWPATLALLQHHHHLLEAEAESQATLFWPLPPGGLTYYLLADQLPIQSEMDSYPDGGWMALLVSFSTFVQALLETWQARWRQHRLAWTGVLALVVDGQICLLDITPEHISLVDSSSTETRQVTLSAQVFTQLALGFRPVSWAIIQEAQSIPVDLVPVLDVLFPCKQTGIARSDDWIAGSDYF